MNTLPKSESLKSKKLIRLLFSRGKSEFIYPFKIVYHFVETEEKPPVLLLIKRLFREAYRKHKHPLSEALQKEAKHIALGFIYVGRPKPDLLFIEDKVIQALHLMTQKIVSSK